MSASLFSTDREKRTRIRALALSAALLSSCTTQIKALSRLAVSDPIPLDTTPPTVAISSPAANAWVNSAAVAAYSVSGTCSEEGRTVYLTGAASGSAICSSGAWNATLDFSAATDGAVTLRADLADSAGNAATPATRAFMKDATAPSLASVAIANPSPTGLLAFGLSYGAVTGTYDDYCIRENAPTSAGCAWTTGTLPASYLVASTNGSKALSVFLRDTAGNVSAVATSNAVTYDGTLSVSPSSFTLTATPSSNYVEANRMQAESIDLADGRILVAGGNQDADAAFAQRGLRTCLIVDPSTEKVIGAAPMRQPRTHMKLVRLADGKVLAIGGYSWSAGTGTPLALVERFDPVTRKWTRVSDLPAARAQGAAARYVGADGREKVLYAGGVDATLAAKATVYIYDVAVDAWSTSSNPLPAVRIDHALVTLPNGDVLAAAGVDGSGSYLLSSVIFNHADTTWGTAKTMANWHAFAEGVVVTSAESGTADDKVYLAGGSSSSTSLQNALSIYDLTTNTWSAGSTMGAFHGEVARLIKYVPTSGSAKLYIVGGSYGWSDTDVTTNANSVLEMYDTGTGAAWAAKASLPVTVSSQTVAYSAVYGKIVVWGGRNTTGAEFTGGYTYDVATDTWSSKNAEGLRRRIEARSVALADGRILTCGGQDDSATVVLRSCAIFDPETNAAYPAAPMTQARRMHEMALIENGKVLAAGGNTTTAITAPTATTEIYDPATNAWTAGPTMGSPRATFTMTALDPVAGKVPVLIMGGFNYTNYPDRTPAGPQVYYDGSLASTGAIAGPYQRYVHQAAKIGPTQVMITGGIGTAGGGCQDSVEVYDYGTNSFAAKAPMNHCRDLHVMQVLSNGHVIVTSGYDATAASGVASTEDYDPATDVWTTTTNIPSATGRDTATWVRLANDDVLVIGGRDTNRMSLYDSAAGTWTSLTAMNKTRWDANASYLLADASRILIFGAKDDRLGTEVYQLVQSASFVNASYADTTSGGDKNYSYAKVSGTGTMYDLLGLFFPPYPLSGGPARVQVTDGNGSSATYDLNF